VPEALSSGKRNRLNQRRRAAAAAAKKAGGARGMVTRSKSLADPQIEEAMNTSYLLAMTAKGRPDPLVCLECGEEDPEHECERCHDLFCDDNCKDRNFRHLTDCF